MAKKSVLDALDLKVLAHANGLDEAEAALTHAKLAIEGALEAIRGITIELEVE